MSLADLTRLQNPDGGWSYGRGVSWTEPTVFALLALSADTVQNRDALRRGADWLRARQRSDGGWAPEASVEESTWVTALPLLLPPKFEVGDRNRAAAWVLSQSGRETGWVYRLRMFLLGAAPATFNSDHGWPWYPGAAAWVVPTSLTVLAFGKQSTAARSSSAAERVRGARNYLLSHMCAGGGWNHGASQALGYNADPYPETTGVALLALRGSTDARVKESLHRAARMLAECRSAEGLRWLQLGLAAHGQTLISQTAPAAEGTIPLALGSIVEALGRGIDLIGMNRNQYTS